YQADLPIISGIGRKSGRTLHEALRILSSWKDSQLSEVTQISSITWHPERGFRALVSYPLLKSRSRGRVLVELGQEPGADSDIQLTRLDRVFRYLSANDIAARQIWADIGKKIVVKIARG